MKRLLILLFVLISLGSFGQGRIVVKIPSVTIPSSLPSHTGNAGKYLTTDGTTANWGTVSGSATTTTALTDVSDAVPTNNATLVYNQDSLKYVPTQVAAFDFVDLRDGDELYYDSLTTRWRNKRPGSGSGSADSIAVTGSTNKAGFQFRPSDTALLVTYGGTVFSFKQDGTGSATPVGGYDADALSYFSRVEAAGGTLSTEEKNAYNTFVTFAKGSGYYTKLKVFYPYLGGVDAARKLNAISSSFAQTWNGGIAWNNGTLKGVQGDGTTGYIQTGFNPSTQLSLGSVMYGAVIAESAASETIMGAYETLSAIMSFAPRDPSGFSSASIGTHSLRAEGDFDEVTDAAAVWGAIRSSTTDLRLYRNTTEIGVNTDTDSGTLPNLELYLCARNSSSGAQVFSTYTHRATYVGTAFTSGEWSAFVSHLNTLLTAIGH
jgi:hypothetical protein